MQTSIYDFVVARAALRGATGAPPGRWCASGVIALFIETFLAALSVPKRVGRG